MNFIDQNHLLVDAKNTIFRCIFSKSYKDHPVDIFFRIISSCAEKTDSNRIHIFWDCPRKDVWRKKILPEYKENRKPQDPEIGDMILKCINSIKEACNDLPVRQYYADNLEADDLIYTFSMLYKPAPMTIVSTDRDLYQIPFRFENVQQILKEGKIAEIPDFNPVIQKALTGDKGDNIDGYKGIGPVKSEKMIRDNNSLMDFIKKDPKIYLRNINLVDLSMCPLQTRAQYIVMNGSIKKVGMDFKKVRAVFNKYNIYPKSIADVDWNKFKEEEEDGS